MYEKWTESATSATAGYGTHNATTAIAPDPSPSIIRDGVSHAEENLSEVHDAISQLEKRLETVLRPVPPQADVARTPQPSGPPTSHVSGRLAILNDGYRQAVHRLRDLAQRVEV